jgi:hypothetical protein
LPNPYRDVAEWVETARQPRVLLPTPFAQAVIAFCELREPCDLLLLDFRWGTTANADPVHQAVPSEGERAEAPRRPSSVLTARQSWHASHDHRVGPPAVALKQMMHRSSARETSQPTHFSGESSSGHDCQRPCSTSPHLQVGGTGPRNFPHGICTDNSVIRFRSAASVALSFRLVIFRHSWQRLPRASTTCTRHRASSSPEAPCSGGAVAGTAGQVPKQPSAREPIPG